MKKRSNITPEKLVMSLKNTQNIKTMEQYVKSKQWYYREAVVLNKLCPQYIIEELVDDNDFLVCFAAIKKSFEPQKHLLCLIHNKNCSFSKKAIAEIAKRKLAGKWRK